MPTSAIPFGRSWFALPYRLKPIAMNDDIGIRYPDALVEKFLKEFTKKGERVLDPFAGFGTTLIVAQKLGRIGIGIEYDKKRAAFINQQLRSPGRIIHGDARKIVTLDIPKCDFSMTSPPYMQAHHRQHPLSNYTKAGTYRQYLADLRKIYARMKHLLKRNAPIILEVSNIVHAKRPLTPLAWDIARELSEILFFEREFIFCHQPADAQSTTGTQHSYCLLFRNR